LIQNSQPFGEKFQKTAGEVDSHCILYPLLPWTRASLHSVSSSTQSQLSTTSLPYRTSALRDKNFIM